MQTVFIQYYDSPCGEIVMGSIGKYLCLCDWNGRPCAERNIRRLARVLNAVFLKEPHLILELAKTELDEYFKGQRTVFTVSLRPIGTEFQQRVWNALLEIPYRLCRRTYS